jgi:benzoate-CoA ligase family protein
MELELEEQLNVADFFLDARLRAGQGERTALIYDRVGQPVQRMTYAQVEQHANRFAHTFADLGLEPEQRVLLAVEDGPDFVGAFFGALKLGAVVVMANPELSAAEAEYFLSYTRAKIAVVGPSAVEAFAAAADHAELLARMIVVGDSFPPGRKGVRFSDVAPEHPSPFETFASHRDDPAIWLFSGGTTGKPKAVVQTHGAFVNTTVLYAQRVLGYCESDLTLSVPKLYFGYATGSNLLFPMSVGAASILFPERVTAARLFELIARHKPSILINVPTMVGKMLDAPGAEQHDLSCLRIATSAGEALPEALYQRWLERFRVQLLDGLGTAEMWHVFLTNRPGQVRPGTLGQVVPGFEIRVCDDEGKVLGDDEVGFLWVRGKSRGLGYVQQHDKSCQTFIGEWVALSDMVRRDAHGTFTYCGRSDDMLKVAGKWLAPKEVEGCLALHPNVEECAVIGAPDGSGLVKPYAFVRAREARVGLEEELKEWVRQRLALYKAPREVVLLADFPRTHLGKVDRGQLRRSMIKVEGAHP